MQDNYECKKCGYSTYIIIGNYLTTPPACPKCGTELTLTGSSGLITEEQDNKNGED